MSSLKHLKIAICNDYCLSMFCPQCLHLYSKRFILSYFAPQKLGRQLGFFRPPCRRQEIDIAQLTLVLAEALHLDQTLFNQNLEAEIDRTKLRLRILSLRTLTDLESLMQTAQNFELNFLLKTSHFLEGKHEAQGNSGALPPCRFTISKRGQRVWQQVRSNRVRQKN
ncbi:hypothetical protein [Laribacter hongkongensis]|uniref:hypothetical protein n=1 Tax=Laribacter hongkongensis TaxID=168471 RepID=UPI001EFE3D37|nr:hypothetical protein [Laribacter hongkongensis]